jgi:hypothetical protein
MSLTKVPDSELPPSQLLPSGLGSCLQLPNARAVSFQIENKSRISPDTLIEWLVDQGRLGPHSQPDDPTKIRMLEAVPPDLFRKIFWDSTRNLYFAATVSKPTSDSVQSHAHTIGKVSIVGCTLVSDRVRRVDSDVVWTQTTALRLGENRGSWLLGLYGRLLKGRHKAAMSKAVRQLKSG